MQQQQGYQQPQQQQQGYQQQQGQQQGYQQQQQGQQQQTGQQYQVVGQGQMQPQVVVIVQGGGMNFGDALSRLGTLPAVLIKQKFEWLEAAFGFETPNTYLVWPANQQGDVLMNQPPVLRFKEKSSCCQRQCLHGDCRAYQLMGHSYQGMICQGMPSSYNDQSLVMRMDRECACTFLCCNRPFIDIFDTFNGQNRMLGKIVAPYQLCNHGVEVFNEQKQLIYIVEASCCQTIFWVDMPCKSCQTCKFVVYDANRQPLTELWKQSQGCCKACLGDQGDTFRVVFPPNSTNENKALLMAAALFIDYRFFENRNQQQDEGISINI